MCGLCVAADVRCARLCCATQKCRILGSFLLLSSRNHVIEYQSCNASLLHATAFEQADPLEEPVRMRKLRLAKEAAAGTADVKKQIRYLHNDVIPGITRPYVPVN